VDVETNERSLVSARNFFFDCKAHFFLIKKSLIFYVELIRLNRMSRQKKKEFLLSQPSGLGEESKNTPQASLGLSGRDGLLSPGLVNIARNKIQNC
jgi:hypothetical protein